MNEIIRKVASNLTGNEDEIVSVVGLYGDASYRRYFRVTLASGQTLIVMKMPEGAASVSEEITNFQGPKEELPYIDISNLLRKKGLPVPEIFFYDKDREALILEDIGDQLFYNVVHDADDELKWSWYKRAIDMLSSVQRLAVDDSKCIAFKRSFDATLLNWEFDHFLEYGIEARLGRKLDAHIRSKFVYLTRAITDEITGMNYGFTHRDYQSRNLMVKDQNLYIIDFQDALLGPICYDLVALTRDSYIKISDDLLNKLISYYCGLMNLDQNKFVHDFDLVTIQRKLKDAGRFVYIDRVKNNPDYLRHIPRSLKYAKDALLRRTEYTELFTLLKPFVEEWRNE